MSEKENKTFLLSFPRSGNTWVRYIVEFISGRPTAINNSPQNTQVIGAKYSHMNVSLDSERILIKTHGLKEEKCKRKDQEDRLIFIIRNPFEVLSRKERYNNPLHIRLDRYMHNINCYDMWRGDKILIYYEDLIINPAQNIKKIANFMKLNKNKYNEFMKRYDYHKAMSVKYYNQNVTRTRTSGRQSMLHIHSELASKSTLEFIRITLEDKYKKLTNKYLKRYM